MPTHTKTTPISRLKTPNTKNPTKEALKSKVPFAACPDHTWAFRALEINNALVSIIESIELAKPMMKDNVAIRELLKNVHFFTSQSVALLNIQNQKTLLDICKKNQSGKLFEMFMRGKRHA